MKLESKADANELSAWFQSVQRVIAASLFSIAGEGPHRDAVVLDTLRRNARMIVEAKVASDGKLYSPLCFFLAAACWRLQADLGAGHWRAALDNVYDLREKLESSCVDSANIGLQIGSAAILFKAEFDEAAGQVGLLDSPSFLGKEDRQVALGLAINWGIRLLLAYAGEIPRSAQPSERKDLAWLAEQVSPAIADCP